ncbi:hypothetical protein [Aquimarina sp. RZ0]|uniref:hypothetical protein n=1 Tax=Aquimarina sp. RZ0 TaxID=2607730 RepID=UPI0011F2BC65|nr:hypothetical protein [Aquimarina sp. RZ0]KAA1244519.1 hypothetical protein F0000_16155 [Aquimarina sp. RZ0]
MIPQSIQKDTVIVGSGKAKLEDTLQLMQLVIRETTKDTALLAKQLQHKNRYDTCRNIWNFVYQHIQYTMDKTGIEQVRRPSRSWADRMTGVDCDCYTVFIGSILTNLKMPFTIRITKYGGKHHFQHVYPIVPMANGHITMDCVTDQFNYEVPYSEKKDIPVIGSIGTDSLGTVSGVDMAAISLDALEASPIPLRKIIVPKRKQSRCLSPSGNIKRSMTEKSGRVLSPFRLEDGKQIKTIPPKKDFNLLNFLILSGISVAAGIGVLKLLSTTGTRNPRGTLSTRGKNDNTPGTDNARGKNDKKNKTKKGL